MKRQLGETEMEARCSGIERNSEDGGSKALAPDEISHLALDIGGESRILLSIDVYAMALDCSDLFDFSFELFL